MNWYKLATENISITREDLSDRTRIYLMNKGKVIGKLTLQFYPNDPYYYLTAFKIDDPCFRGTGWGTKMLNELLSSPQFQDKPIVVEPAPYGGDIGSNNYNNEIQGLQDLYRKFGFESFKGSYMIRRPKRTGIN